MLHLPSCSVVTVTLAENGPSATVTAATAQV